MRLAWLCVCILLAGCTESAVRTDEATNAPLPADSYLAVADDSRVYRIDPQRSVILVRTGRSGPAARLGHDHAIASESIAGFVEIHDDPNRSRADVAFAIRELIVDKPEYRDQLQLDTTPSESDIAGTYTNMLKVVPPDPHPWITINATIAEPGTLAVAVTLTGRTVNYVVPATIDGDRERATVRGSTTIRHTDFGLSPFSAVGGLLRVSDELDVRFDITAERVSP
ncbi:MAG: YceI family protein [Woeseiaceae bacterium]|nr:YceI family protein [Woeseiaceae bacterium]